jgi:hypothetical protein
MPAATPGGLPSARATRFEEAVDVEPGRHGLLCLPVCRLVQQGADRMPCSNPRRCLRILGEMALHREAALGIEDAIHKGV